VWDFTYLCWNLTGLKSDTGHVAVGFGNHRVPFRLNFSKTEDVPTVRNELFFICLHKDSERRVSRDLEKFLRYASKNYWVFIRHSAILRFPPRVTNRVASIGASPVKAPRLRPQQRYRLRQPRGPG
jgi:hypothetical protein